jgi:hypothetical protein
MSGFSSPDLDGLVADFSKLSNVVTAEVKKSVQQTAMETKKTWSADARGAFGSLAGRYAPTIDYDVEGVGRGNGRSAGSSAGGTINAQIGPNLGRYTGGGLAAAFGTFEEANGGIRGRARGSVRRAEKFAAEEFTERMQRAVDESAKRLNL